MRERSRAIKGNPCDRTSAARTIKTIVATQKQLPTAALRIGSPGLRQMAGLMLPSPSFSGVMSQIRPLRKAAYVFCNLGIPKRDARGGMESRQEN
jgi:hypothetical protein